MNVTLSVSGKLMEGMRRHSSVKWTEVAREAMARELERLMKAELLQKFLHKERFSQFEEEWMEEHDWHPVDEMQLKPEFIKRVQASRKEHSKKIKNVSELLKSR